MLFATNTTYMLLGFQTFNGEHCKLLQPRAKAARQQIKELTIILLLFNNSI